MRFDQRRTWLLGVPLPRLLAPRVSAVVTPVSQDWNIDVRMAAPLIGPLIRYHGIMIPAARLAKENDLSAGFRQELLRFFAAHNTTGDRLYIAIAPA